MGIATTLRPAPGRLGPALALALGLTLGWAGPGGAATLKIDYAISLAGLPLGSADFATTVEGDRYRMQIQARLTGLAGALTGGKGAGTATGALAGGRPVPTSFAVTSRSSSEQRTVRVALVDGTVAAIDIAPPLEEKPDRVPLTEAHKRGVIDPASALLMPMGAGGPTDASHCNRTLPVFDGAARFDVVLSYAETRTVHKPGYSGPVLVCNARYVPIAGHRTERPSTRFMEQNRDMQVWLAPVEGLRLLVPVRISVRTMLGTSLIEASRWSLDGDGAGPNLQRRARAD